ncbi:Chorismate mutase [Nocardia seriolae]|uniref:chorismate mutase n=1 Tax=Nocardia seriolae TaxID=37332 RepID=A0ABC8AXP1_9NOCA|nr:gamma subclass chorismate mutase AroQ [Nocardia seriolae]APA98968.1 Chorismate mutase [Nocardia seriolae]
MRVLAVTAVSTMALVTGQFVTGGGQASADTPGSLDRLVTLLAERLDTADTVAAAKWATAERDGDRPVIDDPAREATIYDAMTRLGAQHGLPAPWVRQIFEGQIEANKIVQRGLVTQWEHGVPAPAPSMELAAVRPVIDRVNGEIIDELASKQAELADPSCPVRLTRSVLAATGTRHGDPLHQAALVRASIPLCES